MSDSAKHTKINDPNNITSAVQICPQCKYKNDKNSIYCISCGYLLNNTKYCYVCFHYIPLKSHYCPYCGTYFSPRYCGQCGALIVGGNFCHSCGCKIQRPILQTYSYAAIPNFSYVNNPINTGISYKPFVKTPAPKWWKSPAFFIAMCITGLAPVSYVVSSFLIGLFFLSTRNYDQFYFIIYVSGGFLATLLLIIAIFNFSGFRSFWTLTPEGEQEQKPNAHLQNLDMYSQNHSQKVSISMFIPKLSFKKLFWALIFITFFVLILLVAEDFMLRTITFFKVLIRDSAPTTSSYNIYYQNNEFFLLFIFLAIIFAPIHEELLFRGFLQQSLYKADIPVWSQYVIQAVAFAYLHLLGDIADGGSWDFIVLHMISIGMFALCATWLKRQYKTVIICMIFHSLSNAVELFLPYITTYLPLNISSDTYDLLLTIIFLIGALALFLLLAYFKQINLSFSKVSKANIRNRSIINFVFRFLLIFIFFDLTQLIFVVLVILNPTPVTILEIIIGYVLFIFGIYILWGKNIVDKPWRTYFP